MNIWAYIGLIAIGVIIGMVLQARIDKPDTVINENQKIGKIKQRGEGNDQDTVLSHDAGTPVTAKEIRKEKRKQRREERRAKRNGNNQN